jgi:PAS domain S-box-containing protein
MFTERWRRLTPPQSLRRQFILALSVLALLIVAGGLTAVYALRLSTESTRQLAGERLQHMQEAQDLVLRTLLIERESNRMTGADSAAALREGYAGITQQLELLDQLVQRLVTGSDDVSVLALHQSAQLFRNTANVVASLLESALQAEADAGAPGRPAQQDNLHPFRDELQRQVSAMTSAAQALSAHFTEDYRAAVKQLAATSQNNQRWVLALLVGSLVLAWLGSKYFLGQQVLGRLQQVSHYLRLGDGGSAAPRVPVTGSDEIGQMARAVELFMADRQQLAAANQALEAERARQEELIKKLAQTQKELEAQVVKVSALNHDMAIESAERQKAEEKYRAIFEHATEGIFQISLAGRIISANMALARMLGHDTPQQLQEAVSDIATEVYTDPSQHGEALALLQREGSISQLELSARRKDGSVIWVSMTARLVRDADGTILFYEGTMHDVTRRKLTESALRKAQADLVSSARQAGMAEIASNVLHNVGNVLNSVNVSASLINGKMRDSKARGLVKAVELMDAHGPDLGHFLTQDDKGKVLPAYLRKAVAALVAEQQSVVGELNSLTKSIDHIKEIVAMQQSYAGDTSVVEPVRVGDLLEEALRMNATALARHRVAVVREFAELPVLLLDKPRLLQILVNLISNAGQAMDGLLERPPRITLRADITGSGAECRLRVQVEDAGEGIAPENLERIFAHGFTTRENGHGFGLHSCILAAQAMGGTLTAHSDGTGLGATFTLTLPIQPTGETHDDI